jgi:hypothetical protein
MLLAWSPLPIIAGLWLVSIAVWCGLVGLVARAARVPAPSLPRLAGIFLAAGVVTYAWAASRGDASGAAAAVSGWVAFGAMCAAFVAATAWAMRTTAAAPPPWPLAIAAAVLALFAASTAVPAALVMLAVLRPLFRG